MVNVVKSGELLSRAQAKQSGNLRVDIAAPDIIDHTDAEWQDYVRLYFRPRTPTQYLNEGFRPVSRLQLGAHCPVPVYLLFDAYQVLSRQDSLFTEGNLAARRTAYASYRRFEQDAVRADLPRHWLEPQEGAEDRVPSECGSPHSQRLDLRNVRHVLCRSQAEYETLLNLLPLPARKRWADKVGVVPRLNLFHGKWSFVDQVELADEHVLFRFNQATTTPGPFAARVEISVRSVAGSGRYRWARDKFMARDTLNLSLNNAGNPHDYSISLYLDDHIAFEGRHEDYDLPF